MNKRLLIPFLGASLASCTALQGLEENTQERTLQHGGRDRTYFVHVPPKLPLDKPVPLVFVLHGGGSNARQMIRFTGFSAVADQEGFLAVYPDGIDRRWNDGRLEERNNIDDVGFILAILDRIGKELAVDPKRVFSTGISNGGFMSQRLAAECSEKFAAIAPVAAGMPQIIGDKMKSQDRVSVLIINGTEDPLVPYHGGSVGRDRGVLLDTDETVRRWVAIDQGADKPEAENIPDADPNDGCRAVRFLFRGDGADVVLIRIDGGGHTWPGGIQYLGQWIIGRVCRDFDGTRAIWDFFRTHPKR